MTQKRVLIIGAGGRDYHNFNMVFRDNPEYEVVGFTMAQLPVRKVRYPAKLAGKLYPNGIPTYDESEIETLVKKHSVDYVCLSYSDLGHNEVMHIASRGLAAGASFLLLGPRHTMLESSKKVIAVCATRTGAGKSPLTEYISTFLRERGYRVGIVRHPMPYGDLAQEEVQKFAKLEDLDAQKCTVEEREDYERHIMNGFVVYAGVDYAKVLRLAESENDVIIWDGGNNDFPFFRPDMMITVADAMRAGHETLYYPGEVNFRMCDVIAINKWENNAEGLRTIMRNAKALNPQAELVRISMEYEASSEIRKGARALVVDDGPTLTHGGMPYGVGYLVAMKKGCKIIDGRRYAEGAYRELYRKYGHIHKVVPAVGYSKAQIGDLKQTIMNAKPQLIISATPADLTKLLNIKIPIVKVSYKLKRNIQLERAILHIIDKKDERRKDQYVV